MNVKEAMDSFFEQAYELGRMVGIRHSATVGRKTVSGYVIAEQWREKFVMGFQETANDPDSPARQLDAYPAAEYMGCYVADNGYGSKVLIKGDGTIDLLNMSLPEFAVKCIETLVKVAPEGHGADRVLTQAGESLVNMAHNIMQQRRMENEAGEREEPADERDEGMEDNEHLDLSGTIVFII